MMTTNPFYANIWEAIEEQPGQAASMRARSRLMMGISVFIQDHNLTQKAAGILFGVPQPRISDLIRGKINLFSLDTLMDMAQMAGMDPSIQLTKPKAPKLPPKTGPARSRKKVIAKQC